MRTRPCVLRPFGGCGGRVDPHHAGRGHGMGQRAPDATAIPLCRVHHDDWHDGRGVFLGWDREERRAWADDKVSAAQAAYADSLEPGEIPF